MASKRFLHILLPVLLILAAAVLPGCREEDDLQGIDCFSVSGIISDKNSGEPVQGITVLISAYSVEDLGREDGLYRGRCLSSSKGEYQFFVDMDHDLSNVYFVFEVKDEDQYRNVSYLPTEMVIFMSKNSKLFNPLTGVYELHGNDFSLSPQVE